MSDEKQQTDLEIVQDRMKEFLIQREDDLIKDYNISRKTIQNLIEAGSEAMESALELAKETEAPRSIEVLSGLLRTLGDLADKIPALHDKMIDIEKKKKDLLGGGPNQKGLPQGTQLQQNNIYVGSTAELLDIIEKGGIIDTTAEEVKKENE